MNNQKYDLTDVGLSADKTRQGIVDRVRADGVQSAERGFQVGDRVYLMHPNDTESPCGWYILHRVRTPSGKIETPDTWVTLCRENNEPGDYITATAKDISLTGPVKLETYDVPVVVQIKSSSKADSVARVLSFLEYAQDVGNHDEEIKGCYIGAGVELTEQKGGAISVDSNPKPSFCPFCGTRSIIEIGAWKATYDDDIENTASLIEYQCQGNCQGRSFWI